MFDNVLDVFTVKLTFLSIVRVEKKLAWSYNHTWCGVSFALVNKRTSVMHTCSPAVSSLLMSALHCRMMETYLINGFIWVTESHVSLFYTTWMEDWIGFVWIQVTVMSISSMQYKVLKIQRWPSKWLQVGPQVITVFIFETHIIKIKSRWNYHLC